MKVLVTGGAGYIGSHAVKRLLELGHQVIVLDNLSRGHRASVPSHLPFFELDVRNVQGVTDVLVAEKVDCVLHFAALAYVGESMDQPLRYFENNTSGTIALLCAMQAAGVARLVFSSTCATYGQPGALPIREAEPQNPINPYGWSKFFVERILAEQGRAQPSFAFAVFRYFNVAGCALDGSLGEDHDPETHLIPVALQVALGQRDQLLVFGDDYATRDGTCIRDYIHVEDLVEAHVGIISHLRAGDARIYNLGIGQGYSVREVIEAVRHVTRQPIKARIAARRPGDPPELFASPDKALAEFGWQARMTDLDQIVESAWRWFRTHPCGYPR